MLRIRFAEKDIGNVSNDGSFPVTGPPAHGAPCRIRSNVWMMKLFPYRLILYQMQASPCLM